MESWGSRQAEQGLAFTVDLETQDLRVYGLQTLAFAIPDKRRLALLNGWDETDQIANQFGADIDAFETRQCQTQPWLHAEDTAR